LISTDGWNILYQKDGGIGVKKRYLALWAAAIVLLPLGACLCYDGFTGALRRELNTAAGLYLALVDILTAAFLSWLIYFLEQERIKRAERQEEEDARRMLLALLKAGLPQTIYRTGHYIQISDEFLRLVTPASRSLTMEETTLLTDMMETLQSIGRTELDEDAWEAGEQAARFAAEFLPGPCRVFRSRMLEVKNWQWLVEEGPQRAMLARLGWKLEPRPQVCVDDKGRSVFQDMGGGRYKVWTAEGRMVLDGVVEDGEVEDGYAELNMSRDRYYCGQFKKGRPDGKGTEYFSETDGVISREGLWSDGELTQGKAYQVLLEDDGELDEYLTQLDGPEAVRANEDCFPPFKMCDIEIKDGKAGVIRGSEQSPDEFCAKWSPRTGDAPQPPDDFKNEW